MIFLGRKTIANVSFAKKKIQYRKSCNSLAQKVSKKYNYTNPNRLKFRNECLH